MGRKDDDDSANLEIILGHPGTDFGTIKIPGITKI